MCLLNRPTYPFPFFTILIRLEIADLAKIARIKSLPLGSLTGKKPPPPSRNISLLAKLKPAGHYESLPSLKTSPTLIHNKLHGYLGASPNEETLLREKIIASNMDSRSLRTTCPARYERGLHDLPGHGHLHHHHQDQQGQEPVHSKPQLHLQLSSTKGDLKRK